MTNEIKKKLPAVAVDAMNPIVVISNGNGSIQLSQNVLPDIAGLILTKYFEGDQEHKRLNALTLHTINELATANDTIVQLEAEKDAIAAELQASRSTVASTINELATANDTIVQLEAEKVAIAAELQASRSTVASTTNELASIVKDFATANEKIAQLELMLNTKERAEGKHSFVSFSLHRLLEPTHSLSFFKIGNEYITPRRRSTRLSNGACHLGSVNQAK